MKYNAEIKKGSFTETKSDLQIEINNNILKELQRHKTKNIEITIPDNRFITHEQRKKAYATINDIADWTGDVPDRLKEYFKYRTMALTGCDYFSLSNCTCEEAREYINTMIDFCLEWEIPLSVSAAERTDDIERYLYKCLETRTCAISNTPNADVHHVDKVGMGRNRKEIDHSQLRIIALSREWHNKVHQQGEKEIFEKYKVYGIRADKALLKHLNLNYGDIK